MHRRRYGIITKKNRFYSKIPLSTSLQKAHFGVRPIHRDKWLLFRNIFNFTQGQCKLKSREELVEECLNFLWFLYVQL